ncbi:tyrosine-protein phosphatase non-receptor type [Acrasis kona]|uniref:Tyrosine-protein phosphatase non-receptor type n=1 Tax=Acrasis kona TaxID=1008807 RepID=A0AAW2YVQ7_9EUKA
MPKREATHSPSRSPSVREDFHVNYTEEVFCSAVFNLDEHIKELYCRHMDDKGRERFLKNHRNSRHRYRTHTRSTSSEQEDDDDCTPPPPTPYSSMGFDDSVFRGFGGDMDSMEDSSNEEPPTPSTSVHYDYETEKDGFYDEFNCLTRYESKLKGASGIHTSAYQPCNMVKNRYKNILPNENTRVKLKTDSNHPTDYINANSITLPPTQTHLPFAVVDPPSYIATQAPLPETFCDFWRMVWEQEVYIIVMLTNDMSDDKVNDTSSEENLDGSSYSDSNTPSSEAFDNCFNKCRIQKYWPSLKETKTFERLTVTNTREESDTDMITRELIIHDNTQPHNRRLLTFYQYTGWPDMGVPPSADSLIRLIQKVNLVWSKHPKQPILTHCSAGVGRTGTFCTIQIVMQQFKHYAEVMAQMGHDIQKCDADKSFNFNIYNIVKALKCNRIGMVQRKEQYVFCYNTIQRWLDKDGLCEPS